MLNSVQHGGHSKKDKNMELNSNISAVITGGASGLGAATARRLAAKGVKVALFDLNEEKGEALAAELGGVFCKVNVTEDDSVRSKEDGSIKHFPLDAFNFIIQVNLVGTFRCIAKSAAGMLTLDPLADGDRGAMVNTASVAAEDGQIGQAAYSASKGGVVGMTLPIARDLSREGIRVNTILPGIFDTPLLAGAPQNVRDALGAMVPHPPRLGQPDEYAALAMCMIETQYFNGEDVRLDGGIRMAPR